MASPHMFENTTDRFPEKLALIFEAERLTFRQLDEAANQVANFLLGQGLKKEMLWPLTWITSRSSSPPGWELPRLVAVPPSSTII